MRAVNRRLRPAVPLALIGLAALAPFGVGAGSGVLDDMILAAAYVVMALGLNIVVGFAGLLDASGLASELPGIHVNFLLVFVLAVAATTVAGALIGVPTLAYAATTSRS